MFSQKEADRRVGVPPSTVRKVADRLGLKPRHERGLRQFSTGDLLRIKLAVLLSRQGYSATAATLLVEQMAPEFERLIAEEHDGAAAWLVWRQSGEEGVAECAIVRTSGAVARATEKFPDATLIAIAPLLREALAAVANEVPDNG